MTGMFETIQFFASEKGAAALREIESKHRNDRPWFERSPEEEAFDIMRESSRQWRIRHSSCCPQCDSVMLNNHCTHCEQRGQ